jgi:hypothetical protein
MPGPAERYGHAGGGNLAQTTVVRISIRIGKCLAVRVT